MVSPLEFFTHVKLQIHTHYANFNSSPLLTPEDLKARQFVMIFLSQIIRYELHIRTVQIRFSWKAVISSHDDADMLLSKHSYVVDITYP